MVKVSYEQKPYRRAMMETWGATVHASPTNLTNAGRGILAQDPDSPGSLGIAISEAVEDAATHDDAKYSLGSVVNHVLLHQTATGLEATTKLQQAEERGGDARADQREGDFAAARRLERRTGVLPARAAAHAARAVGQVAAGGKEAGEKRTMLFGVSGHGHFEMSAYGAYFAGKLVDV